MSEEREKNYEVYVSDESDSVKIREDIDTIEKRILERGSQKIA